MADALSEALRELTKSGKSRSQTDRLADYFDDVVAALAAGVSRAEVLETLHGHGFTLSLRGFDQALYRLRKRQGLRDLNAAPATPAPVPPPTGQSASLTAPSRGSETSASKSSAPLTVRSPATLPDDWRTAVLTREQARLLTHEQQLERRRARDKMFFPNPYADPTEPTADPPKEKAEPLGSALVGQLPDT